MKTQKGSEIADKINRSIQFLTAKFVMLAGKDFTKEQKMVMVQNKIHKILDGKIVVDDAELRERIEKLVASCVPEQGNWSACAKISILKEILGEKKEAEKK